MKVEKAVEAVEQEYLSVRETASLLDVKKQTIYTAIRENRLLATRVLGVLVIRKSDAEIYQQRTEGIGPKGGRPSGRKGKIAGRRSVGRPRKVDTPEGE